jgi:hypothetical protein
MSRRFLIAAVVFLALAVSTTAVLPAAAKTSKAVGTHKLIVAIKKNMPPAAGTSPPGSMFQAVGTVACASVRECPSMLGLDYECSAT